MTTPSVNSFDLNRHVMPMDIPLNNRQAPFAVQLTLKGPKQLAEAAWRYRALAQARVTSGNPRSKPRLFSSTVPH